MGYLLAHVLIAEGCYLLAHCRHQLPKRLEHWPELREVLLRPYVWPACHELNSVLFKKLTGEPGSSGQCDGTRAVKLS